MCGSFSSMGICSEDVKGSRRGFCVFSCPLYSVKSMGFVEVHRRLSEGKFVKKTAKT